MLSGRRPRPQLTAAISRAIHLLWRLSRPFLHLPWLVPLPKQNLRLRTDAFYSTQAGIGFFYCGKRILMASRHV